MLKNVTDKLTRLNKPSKRQKVQIYVDTYQIKNVLQTLKIPDKMRIPKDIKFAVEIGSIYLQQTKFVVL